jgi:hypothetical protein
MQPDPFGGGEDKKPAGRLLAIYKLYINLFLNKFFYIIF